MAFARAEGIYSLVERSEAGILRRINRITFTQYQYDVAIIVL
jgi:hypothetical protein